MIIKPNNLFYLILFFLSVMNFSLHAVKSLRQQTQELELDRRFQNIRNQIPEKMFDKQEDHDQMQKVLDELEVLAKKGHARSMCFLGSLLFECKHDIVRATHWYKKSYEAGSVKGGIGYAAALLQQKSDNYQEIHDLLAPHIATSHEARYYYDLLCIETGFGGISPKEAIQDLVQLGETEHYRGACKELAERYSIGNGVEKDYHRALKYYRALIKDDFSGVYNHNLAQIYWNAFNEGVRLITNKKLNKASSSTEERWHLASDDLFQVQVLHAAFYFIEALRLGYQPAADNIIKVLDHVPASKLTVVIPDIIKAINHQWTWNAAQKRAYLESVDQVIAKHLNSLRETKKAFDDQIKKLDETIKKNNSVASIMLASKEDKALARELKINKKLVNALTLTAQSAETRSALDACYQSIKDIITQKVAIATEITQLKEEEKHFDEQKKLLDSESDTQCATTLVELGESSGEGVTKTDERSSSTTIFYSLQCDDRPFEEIFTAACKQLPAPIALDMLNQLSHAGYGPASRKLGELYKNGCDGIALSSFRAAYFYAMAVEQNDDESLVPLGLLLADKDEDGQEFDLITASNLFERAAAAGDPEGRVSYGMALKELHKDLTDSDFEEVKRQFELARHDKLPSAYYYNAELLLERIKKVKDLNKKQEYHDKALMLLFEGSQIHKDLSCNNKLHKFFSKDLPFSQEEIDVAQEYYSCEHENPRILGHRANFLLKLVLNKEIRERIAARGVLAFGETIFRCSKDPKNMFEPIYKYIAECYEKSLQEPDPTGLCNYAFMEKKRGRIKHAMNLYKRAIDEFDFPNAHYNYGKYLMQCAEFMNGYKHLCTARDHDDVQAKKFLDNLAAQFINFEDSLTEVTLRKFLIFLKIIYRDDQKELSAQLNEFEIFFRYAEEELREAIALKSAKQAMQEKSLKRQCERASKKQAKHNTGNNKKVTVNVDLGMIEAPERIAKLVAKQQHFKELAALVQQEIQKLAPLVSAQEDDVALQ